ncbi:olfactory receptor 52D1-like [Mixophyes fleayi]|uniref:olfactory receptor 52D1-like n=1 Tax=Mixophyes fleayi TaxID=3061075 RepID=UPI003F4DD818
MAKYSKVSRADLEVLCQAKKLEISYTATRSKMKKALRALDVQYGSADEEADSDLEETLTSHLELIYWLDNFSVSLHSRYVMLTFTLVGFMMIVLSNCTVITTILLHKSLHEPMYIFISALCVNGLYGSSAVLPSLFINLIYKIQNISYKSCIIQVFCIHTYTFCEITMLAVMAYDRYVCICNPLRYVSIMTLTAALKLMFAAWIHSLILITIHVILTSRLPLCDNVILKIYCDNWSVVRLSCIDTTVNNIFGLFVTIVGLGVKPFLIVLSYFRILKECAKSKVVRDKAMQTCAPQLISIIIFVTGCIFEVLLYRFVPTRVPYGFRVFMSVEGLVLPPLVNPLLYGLKMKAIKVKIVQKILHGKT